MDILNKGMGMGTFLDIEGPFDNVSFDAIKKALSLTFSSGGANRWILLIINDK